MAEKSNTPPPRPKTSSDDRDEYKPKHTSKTNPYGFVAQDWDEDATGRYEGEDLERARAKRPSRLRLAILEKKNDENEKKSAEWQRMYVGLLEEIAKRAASRDQTSFELDLNIKRSDAAIREAEAEDRLAARKARRKLIGVVTSLAAPAGAGIYELLRQLIHYWGR